jgi:hypothetical protein
LKLSSANVLREGKREIRSIGSACDASCAMWAFCQNSVPDGSCKGFLLLNGKSQNLLNKTLNEDDKIYVQNVTRMAQGECNEETRESLVREVLRYIPHQERREGFLAQLEASCGIPTAPTEKLEPESETRPRTEFQRMIQEARGTNKQPHTVIPNTTTRVTGITLRQIDEAQFPELCDPQRCPPDFARHCSANRPENHGKPCIYITPRNR